MKINEVFNNTAEFVKGHKAQIFTYTGIVGFFTSGYLAVRATPKVLDILDESKNEEASKKDIFIKCAKEYLPSVLLSLLSAGCIIYGNNIVTKENIALVTACGVSERALVRYKSKVKELLGPEKEKEIVTSIAKDQVAANPAPASSVIVTGEDEPLFFDTFSQRYFKSSISKIKAAQNELNKRMLVDVIVSLNDFYDEIDVPHLKYGDDIGWNVNKSGFIDITFGATITDDGRPCITISHSSIPTSYNMSY